MASPESVITRHWKELIRDTYGDKLCVVAYDEAHCISEWYVDSSDNTTTNTESIPYIHLHLILILFQTRVDFSSN